MTRPSPAALKYLAERETLARRAYRVAVEQRRGQAVTRPLLSAWKKATAELELCAASRAEIVRARAA
jgi:hypothetical protein